MNKKRRLSLLLALAMIAAALCAGCGGEQAQQKGTEAELETQPADDGVMDVLMIGNSYCYYFIEELYGIAAAAGLKMRVCSVYYDGCTMKQHWNFLQTGAAEYRFLTCDEKGDSQIEGCTFNYCLSQGNWDVITFQPGNGPFRTMDMETIRASVEPYLGDMLEYVREKAPQATYYWQQYWSPEVGNTNATYSIDAVEKRDAFYENVRTIAMEVKEKHNLPLIPTGDAWQAVRDDPVIRADGLTLCTRNRAGDPLYDDFSHDGDVGGGQYLNACVWFEVITGRSCVGNTWRPNTYNLTEEKIALLQQAAHAAVAGVYGEGYAQ